MGQHDPAYVDAFYGPPEWKAEAEAGKRPLDRYRRRRRAADRGARDDRSVPANAPEQGDRETELSISGTSTCAVSSRRSASRVRMLSGTKLSFDEESQALYDAVAPTHPESYFQGTLDELERRLPGQGPLVDRFDAYRKQFVDPARPARAGVRAWRSPSAGARTLQHVELPPEESFTVEYVTEQVVERLQLVSGQLPQPDPGQHRPADLHRPGDRSRVPRGLPRASCLQRAAREAPDARSRLGRSSRSTRCSRRNR